MSRLSKINDLAFDLVHEYMEPAKQFSYGKQIYDLSDEPELNENQQTVLDWLECYTEREAVTPIDAVARFWRERNELGQPSSWRLNGKQQAQVLQAFSRWAIEQEEG